jgi:hypothetical protein
MKPVHDRENHLPDTVSAHLEARLAPFSGSPQSQAHSQAHGHPGNERRLRLGLVKDLKLLFAALGAGNSVVPLGDNGHAARMLSEYANSLRSMN